MTNCVNKLKYDCCGCTACYSACPTKAITMTLDYEGFFYPKIDKLQCINCGKCKKVCPLCNENSYSDSKKIYAVKNKDTYIRKNSSSGGVFSLIAELVQSQGGVVYGAAFDDTFVVRHMRSDVKDGWKKFCVSKYAQSDMNKIYYDVQQDLYEGKTVLFSGTPCQVDGLKHFLDGTKMGNLITCDIVCHGTPSPKVWADYLKYISQYTGKTIGTISFRDKESVGWHKSNLTIKDTDGCIILSESTKENLFFQLYFNHDILRPSCYHCHYTNFQRPADITLGDFWGIEKSFSEFDDNIGTSLVLLNSDVGEKIWSQICNRTEYIQVSKEQCLQPNLVRPSKENPRRSEFWQWYKRHGLINYAQRMGYLPSNAVEKLLIFIYRCENKIRKILKMRN